MQAPSPASRLVAEVPKDAFRIRAASGDDIPLILGFITELAAYEHLSYIVVATEDDLRAALFGARPSAEVLIGEIDGEPAGFALYFQSFSTFAGRPGLYLEDLFVRPTYRRRGLGMGFLVRLAQIAVERNYGRMEWAVLDWNEMALSVYRRVGAEALNDWTVHRLTGDTLEALARRE